MAELFFEDVQEGQEIPTYAKNVTLMELNWFAGANDELVLIHMDRDYSREVAGLPDVIVMGNLKFAYLSNMLEDWTGDPATIRHLECQYRGMDIPGPATGTEPTMYCKGRVSGKRVENGDHIVECEVWVENAQGQRTTPGTATLVLPSRGS